MAVSLTFTGNSNDAEAALARLERKYNSLENAIKRSATTSKTAGSDGAAAFAQWGQSITGISSAFDLATKAIGIFKGEYDDLLSRQKAAKDANVDFGKVAAEMALNLGAGDEANSAIEHLKVLSKRTRVAPAQLAPILDVAQAAKGGLDEKTVDETIASVADIARLSPEAMKTIVGASLDLQRHLPGTTPKQAIGFALNAGAESHVAEASKYATNTLPAVTAIAAEDKTGPEFAASFINAMTKVTNDQEGRSSRTGMLALHYQLKRALPEMKGFEERVRFAQDNPEFTKAFLEGGQFRGKELPAQDMDVTGPGGEEFSFKGRAASFEKKTKPAIEQLLNKESEGYKESQRNLTAIPKLAESDASFEKKAKGVRENPNLQVAEKANEFKIKAELDKLNDIRGAIDATTREGVDAALAAQGFGRAFRNEVALEATLRGVGGENGTHGENVRKALESQRDNLRRAEMQFPKSTAGTDANKLDEILETLPKSEKKQEEKSFLRRAAEYLAGGTPAGQGPATVETTNRTQPARTETIDAKAIDANTKATEELTKAIKESKKTTEKETEEESVPRRVPNRRGNAE